MELTLTTDEPHGPLAKLFAPELARTHERSTVTLTEQDGNAVFHITATDVTALRAAINTVTSVLSVWHKTKTVAHENATPRDTHG